MFRMDGSGGQPGKRLNIVLDKASFENLEKIKKAHGDTSYTAGIKRALAYLAFIDDQALAGFDVYLVDRKKGVEGGIKKVVMPT